MVRRWVMPLSASVARWRSSIPFTARVYTGTRTRPDSGEGAFAARRHPGTRPSPSPSLSPSCMKSRRRSAPGPNRTSAILPDSAIQRHAVSVLTSRRFQHSPLCGRREIVGSNPTTGPSRAKRIFRGRDFRPFSSQESPTAWRGPSAVDSHAKTQGPVPTRRSSESWNLIALSGHSEGQGDSAFAE